MARAAELVAEAVEEVAVAACSGDTAEARRVLRRSSTRRRACRAADESVRAWLDRQPPAPGLLPRAVCELRLVAELERIGALADAMARQVAAGQTSAAVLRVLAGDLETLATCGSTRVRRLMALSAPSMDGQYLRDGAALRSALDHLAGPGCGGPGRHEAPTAATCRGMIDAVLSASSLAARVA